MGYKTETQKQIDFERIHKQNQRVIFLYCAIYANFNIFKDKIDYIHAHQIFYKRSLKIFKEISTIREEAKPIISKYSVEEIKNFIEIDSANIIKKLLDCYDDSIKILINDIAAIYRLPVYDILKEAIERIEFINNLITTYKGKKQEVCSPVLNDFLFDGEAGRKATQFEEELW